MIEEFELVLLPGSIAAALRSEGFSSLLAPFLFRHLDIEPAWASFAASWDDLGPDRYMADGGRYRRRRHAAFMVTGDHVTRKPHQPHFQSRDYNPLNGDIQRGFEPVEPRISQNPVLLGLLQAFSPLFSDLDSRGDQAAWHCEAHQFRIDTTAEETGRPTPEGFHRDGVDWVIVMLVRRENVEDGVTEIGDFDGRPLGRFTLTTPGDLVVLDDRRIKHGVTPITPGDAQMPAFRDVLVVTWTAV